MSNIFIGSDFHWGHTNILRYCPESRSRYNNDIQYMNETMVQEWNDLVSPDDTVYMLGDIAFMSAQKAYDYVSRCNGNKILITGNHDVKILRDVKFRSCFQSIHSYLEITYKHTKICMFHYPIFDHNGKNRGSIMLHGHRHGNPHPISGRIMDVGMDATGQILLPIDTIYDRMTMIDFRTW
jgi:calcineurin-like phosphoesterase family protein